MIKLINYFLFFCAALLSINIAKLVGRQIRYPYRKESIIIASFVCFIVIYSMLIQVPIFEKSISMNQTTNETNENLQIEDYKNITYTNSTKELDQNISLIENEGG